MEIESAIDLKSEDDSDSSESVSSSSSQEQEGTIELEEETKNVEPEEPTINIKIPQGFKLEGAPSRTLVASIIVSFLGLSITALYGPTITTMIEVAAFGLANGNMGVLMGIPNLLGAILRIPLNIMVYRYGPRFLNTVSLAISVLGMACITIIIAAVFPDQFDYNHHYPPLVVFGTIVGIGAASTSISLLSASFWYPINRQSFLATLICTSANLGPGIFTFFIPLIVQRVSLWVAYLIWVCLVALGNVIHFFLAKESPYFQIIWEMQKTDREKPRNEVASLARDIANKFYNQEIFPQDDFKIMLRSASGEVKNWTLSFLYFVSFGTFLGLTVWLPYYFTISFHVVKDVAGFLSGLFSIVTALSRIPAGFILDRLGRPELFGIMYAVLYVSASFILIFSDNFGLSVVGILIMGISIGGSNAAVHHLLYKYLPSCLQGSATIISTMGTFGGFIIPAIMGAVPIIGNGFILLCAFGMMSIVVHIFQFVNFRQIQKQDLPNVAYL